MTDNPSPTAIPATWSAGLEDHEPQIDMAALRRWRLARVRAQLREHDYGACVLFDPLNIRYATGTRNMQVWTQHSPDRYAFVPADGPVVLFDSYYAARPFPGWETVDEWRPAATWYFEAKGSRTDESAVKWAAEIADLMASHGGGNRRLAIDRMGPAGYGPLIGHGLELFDAQTPLEKARAIKSPEEIACMEIAISVCEAGMARMHEALRPGMTENELWSLLIQEAFAKGAESMETRLLASGGRINPWYQECSHKIIRAGELVAFDTDMIGPFGLCVDVSRTFHCRPGRPSDEQRRLYAAAVEQVQHNIALIRPGMSLRELADKGWTVPDEFLANRYSVLAHGVGMADEYPDVVHPLDWEETGYDDMIEENMTLGVESYIGAEGGGEGVKLEEQVLVTANGARLLSSFPYESDLMA